MKNYSQTLLEKFQSNVNNGIQGYSCNGDIVLTNSYQLSYDLFEFEKKKSNFQKTLTIYRDMDSITISDIKLPTSRNNSIMMTINHNDQKDLLLIFSTKNNISEYLDKVDKILNNYVDKKDKLAINVEISLDGEKQDLPFNGHSEGSFVNMFFDNLKANLYLEQLAK